MGKYQCYYCGCELVKVEHAAGVPVPPNAFSLDHRRPRCRGGRGLLKNKVPACYKCNLDKGNLTIEEYRVVLAFRANVIPQPTLAAHRFFGESK